MKIGNDSIKAVHTSTLAQFKSLLINKADVMNNITVSIPLDLFPKQWSHSAEDTNITLSESNAVAI